MPWRLIEFIVIFAVFLVFIGFNLGNKCDISFGFGTIKDVPVFLTAFSSFFFGMLCTLPLILGGRRKKRDAAGDSAPKAKRKWGKKDDAPGTEDKSLSGGGPYGIN